MNDSIKQAMERIEWVKAERAAGREPSDLISHGPSTPEREERAEAYREWALERRRLGLPISMQALMR